MGFKFNTIRTVGGGSKRDRLRKLVRKMARFYRSLGSKNRMVYKYLRDKNEMD